MIKISLSMDNSLKKKDKCELDQLLEEKENIKTIDMSIEERMDLLSSINRQIERLILLSGSCNIVTIKTL